MESRYESRGGNSDLEAEVLKVDLGPMPDNPSYVSEKDIEALESYYKNKPDEFPSGEYIDVKKWENWRNIFIQYNEDNKKWTISYRGFFKGEEVIQEFDDEEKAHQKLDELQDYNKKIALDLIREARNFAIGEEVIGVNATTAVEPESVTLPEEEGVGVSSDEAIVENLPEASALRAELDRLVEVEVQKTKREEATENISYKIDLEKLENFKKNARQAIANYQQFATEHSSPLDKTNVELQDKYRQLEKTAWNTLYDLANLLDGEIATLPQDRDIQLSHPGGIDTKQYLEASGYKFDENGDITHITDNGVDIELNRAMKTDSLIKSSRPSRILYYKSISLDNGMNYQGYLVRGLNPQTPDFIVGVLDKEHLGPVIVDETGESAAPTSEVVVPPETNPEASAENLDILESYRKQGFNEAQLAFIKQVIDAGDTTDQIASYAKPEYEVAQMVVEREKKLNPNLDISQYEGLPYWQQTWIINGIRAGHTPEQIALYAKLGVNSNEIREIERDIQNGLTIEQINEKPIKKITERYLNMDKGFSRDRLMIQLETEGFTNEQATQAIDNMDIDWSQQAIKQARSYLQSRPETVENWSKNELIGQLMGKFVQFTDEQARFAVDNILDYEWKEDGEVATPEQAEGVEPTTQVSLDDLRLAYARAEEAWNRKRGDEDLEDAFELAREAYNTELERVLKLQVAEGQEASIHDLFKKEVIDLREERITQSKELQGNWEKKLNPLKEKFVNFVMKHKKLMGRVNLVLGVAGAGLALTGVGIPLAGGLAVTRRAISGVMLGVSSGEGIRGLGEDTDINWFGGRVKFKAVIPKIVQESLASSEDEFKKINDDVLKDRLGTLEAYYRLNGGTFTNDDQQKAYEKVLTELGNRVKVNTIENYQNENASNVEVKQDITQDSVIEQDNQDTNSTDQFNSRESRYYVSVMLNTISEKRITDLDKFKINRRNATIAGLGVGILVGGAVHALDEFNKPDSIAVPESLDAETQINPSNLDSETEIATPGADLGAAEATPAPELPPTEEVVQQAEQYSEVIGSGAEETLRQSAAEQAQELAQDVSSLDSGETIWGEITKQLGENASDTQIQQAVENYLQSDLGQEAIYKLAQGTEGGRELLDQWGIDNAGDMAGLSKEQLFEISRYLAPGELEGLTELSLDNLNALDPAEYTDPSPTEAPTIEPASTEAPAPGTEDIGSKPPAPSSPPAPEVPPVAINEFTKGVSEALGANSLTEAQLQEVIHSFATSEQGSVDLYNQIISNEEGARFLSGFGVNNPADFVKLPSDQIYEIAQTVGVENLDKLPGFELNEIILFKLEDAPDIIELARGTRPLDVVQRYIAGEVGNLPYDSNLGKQVLDTYVQTDAGKQWLYDAIVSNPNPNNQNVQLFREYLRFKGITSPDQFVEDFNWAEFSGNRNIPTSAFWNQIRLPNGGARLQPLSTFLQPSKMTGIKAAVRQVLTR